MEVGQQYIIATQDAFSVTECTTLTLFLNTVLDMGRTLLCERLSSVTYHTCDLRLDANGIFQIRSGATLVSGEWRPPHDYDIGSAGKRVEVSREIHRALADELEVSRT